MEECARVAQSSKPIVTYLIDKPDVNTEAGIYEWIIK